MAVMQEIGIDISSQRSKSVDEFASRAFDYVLTVCDNARESCPIYPGHGNRLHHRTLKTRRRFEGSNEEQAGGFPAECAMKSGNISGKGVYRRAVDSINYSAFYTIHSEN